MKKLLTIFLIAASVRAVPVLHKFEVWGSEGRTGSEKLTIYMGWTNGFLQPRADASLSPNYMQLHNCLATMGYEQAIAIIDKHYKNHPEKWSLPLGEEILEALTVDGGPCEGKNPLTGGKLPDDAKTDTLLNGRAWTFFNTVSWGSETRLFYVRGLSEAFALSRPQATTCSEYGAFKIDDAAQEFDRLYQDAANLRIPMAQLLLPIGSRFNGTCPDDQFKKLLEALRSWAASAGKGQSVTK